MTDAERDERLRAFAARRNEAERELLAVAQQCEEYAGPVGVISALVELAGGLGLVLIEADPTKRRMLLGMAEGLGLLWTPMENRAQ